MALLCEMFKCERQEAMHCGDVKGPHYIHNRIFQDDWPRRGEDLVKLWNLETWRVHITSTVLHKTSTFIHNVPHNIHKTSTFLYNVPHNINKTSTFLHNVPHNIHKTFTVLHNVPHNSTKIHITSTIIMWKCGFLPTILTNYPSIYFIKESNTSHTCPLLRSNDNFPKTTYFQFHIFWNW